MKPFKVDPEIADVFDHSALLDLLRKLAASSVMALDFPAAAKATGLSRSWLYRDARRGKLRVIKAGRKSLILVSDLLAYMQNLPRAKFKPEPEADDA